MGYFGCFDHGNRLNSIAVDYWRLDAHAKRRGEDMAAEDIWYLIYSDLVQTTEREVDMACKGKKKRKKKGK